MISLQISLKTPNESGEIMVSRALSMIREIANGILLDVNVQPNGHKTEILGVHDGRLKIRVQAPPVDDAANMALLEFIAKLFKVKKKSVVLIRGMTTRLKTLEISGVSIETAEDRLKPWT